MVVLSFSATASGYLCQPWNAISHAAFVLSARVSALVELIPALCVGTSRVLSAVVDDSGEFSFCVAASEFGQVADRNNFRG